MKITAAQTTVSPNDRVAILDASHNDALLKLMQTCVSTPHARWTLGGQTVYRIDRSPDYFAYLRAMGGELSVLGVLDAERNVIAAGALVRRRLLWAARPHEMSYLCDLRVHPDHRRTRAIHRLLSAIAQVQGRSGAAYAVTLESDADAVGLTRGRLGFRPYVRRDRLHHMAWPVALGLRSPRGYDVRELDASSMGDWAQAWERWKVLRNLAPDAPPPPLPGEQRLLVSRGGRPVGIASVIDQTAQRRFAPVRLSMRDALLRRGLNVVARAVGFAGLPPAGTVQPRCHLGHLLYDPADPGAVLAVLAYTRRMLQRRDIPLLYFGLSERDPALPLLPRRIRVRHFTTLLSAAGLDDDPLDRPTLVNLHEI